MTVEDVSLLTVRLVVQLELLKTNVSYCRTIFQFELPSTQVRQRSQKFIVKYRLSDNLYCTYVYRNW